MTATARMADVVLPATMFLEHDDVYQGGGHSHIQLGLKLIEPPGECRNNHEVIAALAKRVGASASGLRHERRARSSTRRCARRSAARSPSWRRSAGSTASRRSSDAHFIDGFAWPDRKFRFKPDWGNVPSARRYDYGIAHTIPRAARPLGR